METLLLFAKTPVPGAGKTRLAAERGEAQAQLLATAFLLDVADSCGRWRSQQLGADLNRRVALYVHPSADHPLLVEAARRAGAHVEVQQGDDLSTRLRGAFDAEYERGARSVCAVGADSPTVPAHLLDEAFRALVWERVVLGPTFDGGAWLVGAQRPAPELSTDVPWSTPGALVRISARLRALQVEPHLLPFWYVVDEPAALEQLCWHVTSLRARHPDAAAETWRALGELGLLDREHLDPGRRP